jgi:hypothetical protein
MARALSGETQQRTVILASTSGSAGAAGAAQLARTLPGPVDAVIVLGDMAGAEVNGPVLVPWSNSQVVAPSRLRNTLSQSLTGQAALSPGTPSLAGQFAHLAFPMAASEQAPFGAHHEPAVLVSASGERPPAPSEPTSLARISSLGRAVLQSVNALGGGPTVPAPASYLELGGKLIPGWAVRLLVLALILPVLMTTIDGVARARRRGHRPLRWTAWVLAAALPFALVEVVVVLARLAGLIGAAPSGPVSAGAIPLRGGGIATLAIGACVLAGGFLALRPLVIRLARSRGSGTEGALPNAGGSAAVLLVLCICSLAIWVSNPFAAALLVPALHIWLWAVAPELRLRPAVLAALLLAGLAPPALTVVYYAVTLGLDPLHAVWNGVLLLGGGTVGPLTALEWSAVLGCAVSATLIAIRSARAPRPEDLPVTIRGPVSYAGPGSLGGTESALRR